MTTRLSERSEQCSCKLFYSRHVFCTSATLFMIYINIYYLATLFCATFLKSFRRNFIFGTCPCTKLCGKNATATRKKSIFRKFQAIHS